jgi:hypothetical protein
MDRSRGPESCWTWQAGFYNTGYGQTSYLGKKWAAHRLAWTLTNGPIPPGIEACHNCPDGDNPACCNPAHLFLGTQRDNLADMRSKDRQVRGDDHGQAKVTAPVVRAIRDRYAAGGVTQRTLAAEFGIARNTVSVILSRKIWRHV